MSNFESGDPRQPFHPASGCGCVFGGFVGTTVLGTVAIASGRYFLAAFALIVGGIALAVAVPLALVYGGSQRVTRRGSSRDGGSDPNDWLNGFRRVPVTVESTGQVHDIPAGKARHRDGGGPFCRLKLGPLPDGEGVYAWTVDGAVAYVGQTGNFRRRPNDYRAIYRRQTLAGGPRTTCWVNRHLNEAAERGDRIELWVQPTPHRHEVEAQLIRQLLPPWNRQL